MSDVFYLRPMVPAVKPADVSEMSRQSGGCFDLHRVDWVVSFLAVDGGRMLCWYRAPDAESVRVALRQLGSNMSGVWAGTVRAGAGASDGHDESTPRVALEFEFGPASRRDELATARNAVDEALAARGFDLDLTFTAINGARVVYVLKEADDAGVGEATRQMDHPPSLIWRCAALRPRLEAAARGSATPD
jgi:Nickel responsive protein SCO4226-like